MAAWFNKKVSEEQSAAWYDRVKQIPDEAFQKIVDTVCDNAKYFPTPQDVRNMYEEWLSSHPEKRSLHNESSCDDCSGAGDIRVLIKEGHFTRDTRFRCKACKNWEGSLGTWMPLKYRSELEHMAKYTVLPNDEYYNEENVKNKTRRLPEMSDGGTSHIRDILISVQKEDDIPF